MYISSLDNQFSFKHGINMCICGLKKTVNLYKTKNSSVLMCFIDVCKAFDRANHRKLLVNLNNGFLGTFEGSLLLACSSVDPEGTCCIQRCNENPP